MIVNVGMCDDLFIIGIDIVCSQIVIVYWYIRKVIVSINQMCIYLDIFYSNGFGCSYLGYVFGNMFQNLIFCSIEGMGNGVIESYCVS